MRAIPNNISANFGDAKCRRMLMAEYGDSKFPFYGANEEGENVLISIAKDSIVTHTFQHNGWTRVNYYDFNGNAEGVTFEGRWKDSTVSSTPAEQEPPVRFDFGISPKHSKLYYTATKFVDVSTAAHCQAIHYQFVLTNTDNGLAWDKVDHEDYPASNIALRRQFNAMIQYLDKAWNGRYDLPDPKEFIVWIAQNCETNHDDSIPSYTFALTDIALFYLAFDLNVEKDGKLVSAVVQVDVFNRMYITEDPIGAALVPVCFAAKPNETTQQNNLAFASAVCSEVLTNMGDCPGVQVKLREAIKTLNKLAAGGK